MHAATRASLLSLVLVSSPATALSPPQEMPCAHLRAWPTDQVLFQNELPFNSMFWLPPVDPNFSYSICRDEFVNGRNITRCIRLFRVDDLEPLPWPETPLSPYEIERDEEALDDDAWQRLLAQSCWQIEALGDNGPVAFLGHVCPQGPADTAAPEAPTLTAFYERPVWGTGSSDAIEIEDRPAMDIACRPFSTRVGQGQLRLHLATDDAGPVLVHIQVNAGDENLLDLARPINERLVMNIEIGNHSPETLQVKTRLIDAAGQLSQWAESNEIIDERMGGCACTASESWALGLLGLSLLRRRRRRPS